MKKLFIILSFSSLGLLGACGGGNSENTETEARKETADSIANSSDEATAENPDYEKGLELVGKNDCLTCHKVNEASTGPAYQAVAAKYPNNAEVIDSLANKVIKGGAGNWGVVPMTPHPQLSKEDAATMVKYVLSLKK